MEIQKKIGEDLVFSLNGQPLVTIKDAPQEEPDPKPETGKIAYSVTSSGVSFAGVGLSSKNLVIMDNDFATDSPEFPLLFLAADKGQINLAGCIMHSTHDPNWNFERTQGHWSNVMNQVKSLKNIPQPVKGSAKKLTRPSNGSIDSTQFEQSAGVDLIISTAKKCTPEKPLVIFMGGQSSTVASAYLKDKSIVDRVMLFHVNGYWDGGVDGYNTADDWGTYILIKRMKYVCVNVKFPENRKYWYDGKDLGINQSLINSIPAHATKTMLHNWFNDAYTREGLADSPAVLWYFNPKVWTSVQRKNENGSVVTGNDYDFLFIDGHNWPLYGSTLINEFKELLSNEPPVVTDPGTSDPGPVIPPPIGGLTSGFEEAIRTAGEGRTVVIAPGQKFSLPPMDIKNLTIDANGSIITPTQPGSEGGGTRKGIFHLTGGNVTIKNAVFEGENKGYAAVTGGNGNDVILDKCTVKDFNFTGTWIQKVTNLNVVDCEYINTGWADTRYMTGALMLNNITNYLITRNKFTSNKNNKGTGIESNTLGGKDTSLISGRITHNEFALSHQNPWNNGQSKNFSMELHDVNVRGLHIAYNNFGNEVSLAFHHHSNGHETHIYENEGHVGGDTYVFELVGDDFKIYRNRMKGAGMFVANFQKNGVWSGWEIFDNELTDAPATPSWGALILVGPDGIVNSSIGPNKFPADRQLLKFMGKTGGVTIK